MRHGQRTAHTVGIVMNVQKIGTQFPNFLRGCDFRIAEIKLAGIGAGFDEIGFIFVQVKCFHCPFVYDVQCNRTQRLVVQVCQLENRHGNFDDFGFRDFEETLFVRCFF